MSDTIAVAEDGLLTLDEAAKRLRMTRRSLERLIAAGRFPKPLKVSPRASRVLESDLNDYLQTLIDKRDRKSSGR